jgi:isopropylmalate/homocitrate/citramalate synthase
MDDARIAVETGVDGVDVVIGTSSFLREFSHGKDMAYITKTAIEVINFVKSKNIEVRFSSEDSFRSDLVDLLSIYQTVDKIGVNRVGIADTVGCANPRQVYDLVRTLRGVVACDIEIHLHNDTGMGNFFPLSILLLRFFLIISIIYTLQQSQMHILRSKLALPTSIPVRSASSIPPSHH